MSKQLQEQDDFELKVVSQDELSLQRIVLMAKALSDPIRVRMLNLMAEGRNCCGFKSAQFRPVPGESEPEGICVCEFQGLYSLGQSKVSYHLRILREAGLITEEARGKWTFYSMNRVVARELVNLVQSQLKL